MNEWFSNGQIYQMFLDATLRSECASTYSPAAADDGSSFLCCPDMAGQNLGRTHFFSIFQYEIGSLLHPAPVIERILNFLFEKSTLPLFIKKNLRLKGHISRPPEMVGPSMSLRLSISKDFKGSLDEGGDEFNDCTSYHHIHCSH